MFSKEGKTSRWLKYLAGAAVVATLSLGGASTITHAQQGQENAAKPAAEGPGDNGTPWFKLCNQNPETKAEQCLTSVEVRDADSAQLLVSVSVLINIKPPKEGKVRDIILFGAPVGVLLQPALEYQIDDNPVQKVPFSLCSPSNCIAQIEATPAAVDTLKKGSELKLIVVNPRGQKVSFPITLAGFTKTHEGPPMSREEYEKRQGGIDDKIRSFVEKRRQEIEEEQKKKEQTGGDTPEKK